MVSSKVAPLPFNVPIVDEKGNPTPFFQETLAQLLKEKAATDVTVDAAVTAAAAAQSTADTAQTTANAAQSDINSLVLDDLTDVDTVTTPPTDGQTLIYNHGSSLWLPGTASGGGGSAAESVVKTSGFYAPPDSLTFFNTSTASGTPVNVLHFLPFSRACDIDAVALEITLAGAAGSTIRGGLYTANSVTGLPDVLIEEGTPQAIDTTGIKAIPFAAPRTINGPCWLAVVSSASATYRIGKIADCAPRIFGQSTISGTNVINRLTASFTYAALPANTSGLTLNTSTVVPMFGARIA